MENYKTYNAFKLITHLLLLTAYVYFKANGAPPEVFNDALFVYQIVLGWLILNDIACVSHVRKMLRTPFGPEKKKYMEIVEPKLQISLQEVQQYGFAVTIRHIFLAILIIVSAIKYGDYILSLQWLVHEFLVYAIYGYARRMHV